MVCRDIGGQNTGLERPRTTLATQLGQKVGSFQTSSGFSRAQFFVAHSATSMLFNTFVHRWVHEMVNRGVMCVFHAPVTLLGKF